MEEGLLKEERRTCWKSFEGSKKQGPRAKEQVEAHIVAENEVNARFSGISTTISSSPVFFER